MRTEIRNINGKTYHVTIEHKSAFYDMITVHELTEDGIKFTGKAISNDIEYAISYILEGRKAK